MTYLSRNYDLYLVKYIRLFYLAITTYYIVITTLCLVITIFFSFLFKICPVSVIVVAVVVVVVVVVNISHFHLLFQNHWANYIIYIIITSLKCIH